MGCISKNGETIKEQIADMSYGDFEVKCICSKCKEIIHSLDWEKTQKHSGNMGLDKYGDEEFDEDYDLDYQNLDYKYFCPKCGNHTLLKVSCSINSNGEIRLYRKKDFKVNTRGFIVNYFFIYWILK